MLQLPRVGWSSSPVKTEPLQIVLLLLFRTPVHGVSMFMPTSDNGLIVQEPSMAKNSSPSRTLKTGARLQTTWRSANNAENPAKKPYPTAIATTR